MQLAPGGAEILEFAVAAVVPVLARICWEETGADAVSDCADDRGESVKHIVESPRFSWGACREFSILSHEPVGDLYVDRVAQELPGGETVYGQLQTFAALDRVFVHVRVCVRLTRLVVEHEGGIAGR